jgi:hypothetical protein
MNKKENYTFLQIFGLVLVIWGLWGILYEGYYSGPISVALGIIIFISSTFKSKTYNNRMVYNLIVLVALVILLIGEYFLVPIQNTIFYVLLLMMTVALFIASYFFLTPENVQNKREKIGMWAGLIIFLITFFALDGAINSDFTVSIIGGVIMSIAIAIGLLIRRKTLNNALNK